MPALPRLAYLLFAAHLATLAWRGHDETTIAIVLSSLLMFAASVASASHLMGARAALRFAAIAVVCGWAAEQLGVSRGWFFGSYTYTAVLGPRLGDVPLVIPLMWFALCYVGYVLANLLVWQAPLDGAPGAANLVVQSLLAALLVTAFDLGADPYMVYVLKAWIMTRTDGDWFGETVQGFAGWATVSFFIVAVFRLTQRGRPFAPTAAVRHRDLLLPLGLYAAGMVFQMALGSPVETRTVALFVMGIPLFTALAGWPRWRLPTPDHP